MSRITAAPPLGPGGAVRRRSNTRPAQSAVVARQRGSRRPCAMWPPRHKPRQMRPTCLRGAPEVARGVAWRGNDSLPRGGGRSGTANPSGGHGPPRRAADPFAFLLGGIKNERQANSEFCAKSTEKLLQPGKARLAARLSLGQSHHPGTPPLSNLPPPPPASPYRLASNLPPAGSLSITQEKEVAARLAGFEKSVQTPRVRWIRVSSVSSCSR